MDEEAKAAWRRTVLSGLLERAKDAYQALQSWGRFALLNPARYMRNQAAYNAASRIKYAAYDLGEYLLMDAGHIRRALEEGGEMAELAREVIRWAWRVHRLAIEWGLLVNEEAAALLRRLRRLAGERRERWARR